MNRQELTDALRAKRPHASESTIKTYANILNSLYNRAGGDGGVDWFTDKRDDIIEHISGGKLKDHSQKTLYAALVVLTNAEAYRAEMNRLSIKVDATYKTQRYSDTRQGHVPELSFIQGKWDEHLALWRRNPSATNYQNLIIVGLTCTKLMPPRRSQDWTEMKMRHGDAAKGNVVVGSQARNMVFIVNLFKTAKTTPADKRRFPVPAPLVPIIRQWMKVSDNDHIIYMDNGKPYTSSSFARKLNQLYGPKVSVDMIRSVFLSDLYAELPAIKQLQETADAMGHSIGQALETYVKRP